MLDKQALQQLRQLKRDIDESKERAEGLVKGSHGRFGFVVLDNGSEIFLSPDTMQRLLPGDRIRVEIDRSGKKPVASPDALLEAGTDKFVGRCEQRGKALFAVPDLPLLNQRWLFIPPSSRKQLASGDYVHCRLSRHPFKDGRAQAKVLSRLGAPGEAGVEARCAIAKYGLPQAPESAAVEDRDAGRRSDRRDLELVSIDGPGTQDIDDALFAERNGDGWRLWVAIADPAAFVLPGSELERAACEAATTTYLPRQTLPMLPGELARDHCALLPEADRPALLCQLDIEADGRVSATEFSEALVRSRSQLDYAQVDSWLEERTPQPHAETLDCLAELAAARRRWREQNAVLMPTRPQWHYQLDANGQITGLERQPPSAARDLVEECMIAANAAAAELLGTGPAVFSVHAGFGDKRRAQLKQLLQEFCPQQAELDVTTLDGFREVVQALAAHPGPEPLLAVAGRWLAPARLKSGPAAHCGLGLPAYTTITSPLRRYADLRNQRLIKARLAGEAEQPPTQQLLDSLQQRLEHSRKATAEVERWLKCRWLSTHVGERATGQICHVNSNGFGVRLDDSGIEGFVDLRKDSRKFSFDAHRLRLRSGALSYELEQPVEIVIESVDEAERSIAFKLISD